MRTADGSTVAEGDLYTVPGVHHRLGSGLVEHLHPLATEHPLNQFGGILVFARQHCVATRNEGDLRAEAGEGRSKLCAGNARTNHDHVVRNFGEVIEVEPGEDALPVGFHRVERAGMSANGDDDGLRLDALLATVVMCCNHVVVAVESAAAVNEVDSVRS